MAETYGPYPARFVGLHDGDTLWLDIDLGFGEQLTAKSFSGKTQVSCRVFGINAPELSTEAGKEAKAYAETLLKPGDLVKLVSHGWDAYGGRYDGTVTLPDGTDFAARMVEGGHAEWKSY